MNINVKSRNETAATRKDMMQKRVFTGKKVKMTKDEKI